MTKPRPSLLSVVRRHRLLVGGIGMGAVVIVGIIIGLVVSGGSGPVAAAGPPRTSAPVSDEDGPIGPQPPAVVQVRQANGGKVMVDAQGFTVYAFTGDAKFASRCTGACSQRWRPFVSAGGKPQAGSGVSAPLVGSLQRADGSYQVTYGGAPLYHFVGDLTPGDANGAGLVEFGGTWSPAPPAK